MSLNIIAIEALAFIALFTGMVLIPTIKNPVAGIHNYPPEIQEEYFKTHPPHRGSAHQQAHHFDQILRAAAVCRHPDRRGRHRGSAELLGGISLRRRPVRGGVGLGHLLSGLGAVRPAEDVPPAGHRAHGQSICPEVVSSAGALFPGLLYGTVTGLIVGLLVVVR